jgi:4-amino-4-deoxy-L-arabinose transferase-like glycosyltransferase
MGWKRAVSGEFTKILLILAVAYTLFIHGIGDTSLWDPDEPRQAIMAREMMEKGDYIHPYLNGKPYLEKPPLYPWMIIAASKIQGKLNEFSSRLPAALSATCLMMIVYFLGRLLVDPVGGLMSALVLATSLQFFHVSREAVMDMTFALFIGLTIFLNYVALRKDGKWLFFFSFLPSSLAILAKGPAGLVIAAGTTFIYLFTEKKLKKFMVPLVAGCLVSAAIASIWFLMAGEPYWKEFIFRQNITRYVHAFDHRQSYLFYFPKLFINFLPWSILLPFSIYHGWKRKLWLPLIWFGFTFFFFETSKSKRAIYLLGLFPAMALLCGIYLREKWTSLLDRRPTNLISRYFAIALIIVTTACGLATYSSSIPSLTPFRGSPWLRPSLFLLITACFGFLVAVTKNAPIWALSLLLFFFVSVGFFYHEQYLPVMDRISRSPRIITDEVGRFARDAQVSMVGFNSPGVIFYLGRPVESYYKLRDIKDRDDVALLIVNDKFATPITNELNSQFLPVKKVVYENQGHTIYVRKNGP